MSEETRRDWRTIPAVINADESVSDPVDLGGGRLVGFQMPAAWTAADISFLVSPVADTANLVPLRVGDILSANDADYWNDAVGTETITTSATYFKKSPRSLSVQTPGGVDAEGAYTFGVPLGFMFVHAGTDYFASAYVLGPAGATVEIDFIWYDGAAAPVAGAGPAAWTMDGAWTRLEITEAAPATAEYVYIRITTETGVAAQAITFYVDCVQLEVGAAATDWVPGGGVWGEPGDSIGTPLHVAAPLVNQVIYFPSGAIAGFRYIRVAAGVPGTYVPQAAARTINLIVRPL